MAIYHFTLTITVTCDNFNPTKVMNKSLKEVMEMPTEMTLTPMKFGVKLKLARIVVHLNRLQLGEKLAKVGYSETPLAAKTIWSWESGKVDNVTWKMIECAAKATGQKIEYFLGIEPLDESVSRFKLGRGGIQTGDMVLQHA
jgi:hypothetical protein